MTDKVVLLHEDFQGSPDTVQSSDFYVSHGQAVTNGHNDGTLQFDAVDLSGVTNAKLTLDAGAFGDFEQWGSNYGDFLKIELVDQDGNVHLLDFFTGWGHTLTGSETGQTIDCDMSGLEYDIPPGFETAQLRISSDISADCEYIKVDNVKISGDPAPTPPADCEKVLLHEDFTGHICDWDSVTKSDFYADHGMAVTNGCHDGVLKFDTVHMDGLSQGKLTLDAAACGEFEEWGHQYGDRIRIELVDQHGNVILLDQFTGWGHTLTGSKTGQKIDGSLSGLEYDIPAGLESFHLRIKSSISANCEYVKIDNVKITAYCPPEAEIDAVDDSIRVFETETEGDLETLESGDDSILDNDTQDGQPYTGDVVTVNGQTANVGEFVDLADGGRVKINADGTVDFDADGDFDALNDGESAVVTVDYSISSSADGDKFDGKLNYDFWNHVPSHHSVHYIPSGGGEYRGTVDNLDVNALALSLTGDGDTYKIRYSGYLHIEEAGHYNFKIGGDDGVGIWIDGHLVAIRDGLHGFEYADGNIDLSTGSHHVEIRFFENYGDQGLDVQIKGADTGHQHKSIIDYVNSTNDFDSNTVADEATVTITVLGEDDPLPVVDAVDDLFTVFENETFGDLEQLPGDILSILANDTEDDQPYSGLVLLVDGTEANIGEFVQLADGGRIKINADGTVDFDADGDGDGVSDFEALGNGQSDMVSISYTIGTDAPGGTGAERTITFDDLATQTDISNAVDGVTITATRRNDLGNQNAENAARVYDTSVSGQDNDLQASASGPLSKVLIIQEDNGADTRPDDNYNGGTVRLDFDTAQTVRSVDLIDTEERDGTRPAIVFTFADGSTQRVDAAVTGDREATTQVFNNGAGFADVVSMEFEFIGSAGIDNLVIAEQTTGQVTDTATVQVKILGLNVLGDGDEETRVDEDAGQVTLTNVLDNTNDPEAGAPSVLSVVGNAGNLGTSVAGSNGGLFTIDAQGNASFDTNGDFDDLATGQSQVTTVSYTVTDATGDTDVSTYTVVVDGKDQLSSLDGKISTSGPGNQSLSFIIDHSFNMFRRTASDLTSDPNGDNSNRVIDAVLDQIVEKIVLLDPSQQVHFALTGDDSLVGSLNTTAGAVLEAKNNGTLPQIFSSVFAQGDGTELPDNSALAVDFNFGLQSARDFLTTPSLGFGPNGADEDEIVIITASDGTIGIDPVTGNAIPKTPVDDIVAELTDANGINANIEVVIVNTGLPGETVTVESFLSEAPPAGVTFDPLFLLEFDSDGALVNVDDDEDFGLDDVVANNAVRSAGEVVSVTFGGQTFSVLDNTLADTNPDADVFEFVLTDLDADPSTGVIIGLSTDAVPETIERTEVVFPIADPSDPDAFSFTVQIDPDPLIGGA